MPKPVQKNSLPSAPHDKGLRRWILDVWPFFLIAGWGLLIYSNSLHGEFQFDDFGEVISNPAIVHITDIKSIWNALAQHTRFIGYLTFALNFYFHQYDVFGYHLTNVVIHIINALLVYWLMRLILSVSSQRCSLENYNRNLSLIAALIFLSHPIQTQAVSYIMQRFASLAALFYLLSICLYWKGRQNKHIFYFCGAFLSAILAMLTKETAFSLPFAILLIEYYFLWKGKEEDFPFLWITLFFLLCLIIPGLYYLNLSNTLFVQYDSQSHAGDIITSPAYLLTQFPVIVTYLRLLFIPVNQNLDYDFAISKSLFDPVTFMSFMSILALLVFAVRLFPKRRLISFGISWFFLTLSVESTVIPIRHVIFEHRLYLPAVGFAIAVSAMGYELLKNNKRFLGVFIAIIVLFSFLTYERNKVWQTQISLWQDVVLKSPRKARGYYNLAIAQIKKGNFNSGMDLLSESIRLKPNYWEAYSSRGDVYLYQNNFSRALKEYTNVLALAPDYAPGYNNRGVIYYNTHQNELALNDFNKAIELNARYADAYNNRGLVYKSIDQLDLAWADFNESIRLNPWYAGAYSNRGLIFKLKGDYEMALSDFNKALKINPRFAGAYMNRSLVHKTQGDYRRAFEDADTARSLGFDVEASYIQELKRGISP